MESTKSEFAETFHKFEGAVQRELQLTRQEQDWLEKLGGAHNVEVSLLSQLRSGSKSPSMASPDTTDELVRVFTSRKRDLDHQQAMIGTLTAALDRAREDKRQATAQATEHYGSLLTQAHTMLKARYGKSPSRFALWGNANEAELAWRVIILNQLLHLVQSRVPGSLGTLQHLLSGDSFRIRVVKGFFVRMDGAMKEIRPTAEDAAYHVPKDIPAPDAFEALLIGRAQIAVDASHGSVP